MAWLLSAIFATSVFAQEGGADNPSETTPVVSISGSGTVSEGGTASFILSAEPPPTDRITVNVWIRQEGIFARVGQAGARTVVIGPTGITQLNIATADDNDDEIDGGFAASVVAGPGYVLHESEFSARVGVTDDDPTPTETTGSISGVVFADNDANGEKHLFERGRLWWRVRLLGAFDVAIDRQSADRQGFYQFQQVPPGEYGIVFHHPSSNVVWSRQTISVSRGATSTLDFPVTASGIVYDSASRNPVSGVRLRLTGGDGTPLAGQCLLPGQQDQATAGDGAYRFDLQPGAAADCPVATSRYKIEIVGAPETHFAAVSGAVSPAAEPLDVAACGAGTMACLVQDSHQPPRQGETALYHLDWILGEDAVTALHNHIPVDPVPAEPQEPEDPEEPEEPEIPGPATALGTIFADDNADGMRGEAEQGRSGWLAELVTEAGEIAGSARSDDQGDYFFAELADDVGAVRVRHPDSNMVWAERPIAPVADMASRVDFPLAVGGVIYDSIERTPIPGVRLHLSGSQGSPIAAQCLLPGQQGQTVGADGAYRFDLQPGTHADCPVAATDYGIEIGEVPDAWLAGESLLLPPEPGVLDVAACAVGSTACVVQAQHQAPAGAEDAKHFRRWTLAAGAEAAFHNHIPLDPVESSVYGGLISVSKQALTRFASVGEPVGYEIRLTNTTRGRLRGVELHDDLPNAFNFIADSASIQPVENSPAGNPPLFANQPAIPLATRGNDPVVFGPFDLEAESSVVIRYVTRPSTRARQGSYLNTAMPVAPPRIIGNVAEATVNISSDPLFEQTTVLGQVFLDRDGDGVRGIDEPGIPGVRLATVDGLLIETDQNGRYHVAAVEVDNADRGTNFILKLDPETLPEGAEVAGPNPRVLRITQSLMSRIDFAVQYDENHVRELYEEVPARAVVERTLTRYNTDRLQPVRFESGLTDIPPEYVEQLQQLLDEYADRDNLRVRFVGHTDDVPLSVRIQPEFGDNQGLSEARAREVAEFFSGQLELDPVMVEIEGRAFRQPVASNLTEGGRALNRRVEIEVVFDEVITETSEEFEPEDPSAVATEPETEVSYITMTDVIEPVRFGPDIVALTGEQLDALENSLDAYSGENIESVRLSGVSYVAPGSGDDEALEQARQRAVNVGEAVAGLLGLDESQLVVEAGATTELLAADDTEFGQSLNRRVEVEVSYLSVAEQISSRTILLQPAQLGRTTVVEGAGRIWMTEDAFSREAQLAVLALQPISVNDNGRMTAPTAFAAHGNYEGVAESYRLDLYRATDVDLSRPIASVTASGLAWPQAFSLFDRQLTLEPGEQLAYVLRVIDGSGNQDYTTAQLVNVVADGQPAAAAAPENVIGKSILEGRRITLEGSKVRIHGADFEPGERLEVAGMDVQADVNGKFVTELFLPPGNAEIEVNGGSEGSRWREMLRPEIDENYSFIVGMASLTLGQDSFGGAFEALSDADEFDESLWLDGRLAFYAKARIQGKYLLTAQMDSTEDELSNFGDNLRRRDPRRMFRQLDPDRYYPVYGDDSTTVSDVDTQGALYIRLDWDRNQLLFGNYNTGLTGTENLAYNRSLYGARAQFESERHTAHGDPRYSATAFASESESAAAHVSFRATGGSVYYLRHTDVVQGSEKVWMEVRQRDTRQVIGRREYVEGLDYEIDALQGRIILRRPLQPVSNDYNSAIIRRGIDGDAVYLLVDYEYVPAGFSGDNWIAGGRGKVWLTENFGIGATGITDDSTGEDYRLQGFDISLKTSPGTYFNVEVASSEAAQNAAGFESFDGGLRFSSMDYDNSGQISRGDAIAVEGRIDIADISEMFAGNVRAWWKDRDPGFSSGNIMRNQIVREAGVDAVVRDDEGMLVQASVSELETADGGSANVARLQGDISRDQLTIGGEVRYEDLTRSFATAGFGGVRPAVRGDALMAGARAGYALNEDQTLYASVQTGLDESGQHVNNDRIAAGLETRISEDLSVLVEASDGDFGNALSGGVSYAPVQNFSFDVLSGVGAGAVSEFGGNYQLENGHELYASYISDPDRTFGDGDMFTLGQRRDFGNRFGVYTESHFGENDYYAGANHSFGIDYATESDWILSGVVTTANDDMFANELEREAVSFGASVDREDYKFSARTEYRTDKGSAFEIEQQLFASSYTRVLSESSRVLGRLNLLRTDDDSRGAAEHARFTEFDIGHAWRPAALERWTTLTRYSYLYDAAGAYQIGGGPDQKVHIVSAEALYQFNTRWEIGGKIAWKNGEARAALGIGEWHDYEVSLAVARARYNVVSEWDVLAEYRVLEDRSAGNARDGVLVGAYRSLSENFQIGAGYNFSDFSDDLRDAEYDKRGFFIDIVGSL